MVIDKLMLDAYSIEVHHVLMFLREKSLVLVTDYVRAKSIVRETRRHPHLDKIVQLLESGRNLARSAFKAPDVNYTLIADCLLFDRRIIVPSTLQQSILNYLHAVHISINVDIELVANSCSECMKHSHDSPKLRNYDWERIHIDYAGPAAGKMLFIIVDAYSNWLEVKNTRSMTTTAILDEMSAIYGALLHIIPQLMDIQNHQMVKGALNAIPTKSDSLQQNLNEFIQQYRKAPYYRIFTCTAVIRAKYTCMLRSCPARRFANPRMDKWLPATILTRLGDLHYYEIVYFGKCFKRHEITAVKSRNTSAAIRNAFAVADCSVLHYVEEHFCELRLLWGVAAASSQDVYTFKKYPYPQNLSFGYVLAGRTGFDSRRVRFQIFASGNRAGRCRWSAVFLGDLPFLPPSHSGAAPYSPLFTHIGPEDLAISSTSFISSPYNEGAAVVWWSDYYPLTKATGFDSRGGHPDCCIRGNVAVVIGRVFSEYSHSVDAPSPPHFHLIGAYAHTSLLVRWHNLRTLRTPTKNTTTPTTNTTTPTTNTTNPTTNTTTPTTNTTTPTTTPPIQQQNTTTPTTITTTPTTNTTTPTTNTTTTKLAIVPRTASLIASDKSRRNICKPLYEHSPCCDESLKAGVAIARRYTIRQTDTTPELDGISHYILFSVHNTPTKSARQEYFKQIQDAGDCVKRLQHDSGRRRRKEVPRRDVEQRRARCLGYVARRDPNEPDTASGLKIQMKQTLISLHTPAKRWIPVRQSALRNLLSSRLCKNPLHRPAIGDEYAKQRADIEQRDAGRVVVSSSGHQREKLKHKWMCPIADSRLPETASGAMSKISADCEEGKARCLAKRGHARREVKVGGVERIEFATPVRPPADRICGGQRALASRRTAAWSYPPAICAAFTVHDWLAPNVPRLHAPAPCRVKAVHEQMSTSQFNLRKKSLLLQAYILRGTLIDTLPVKLVTMDGKVFPYLNAE
ncbi:hypothetical protein PR048_000646 [Dryococelus australis]|uniref:Integrase catalytic domain-containing protein n=1 Tax=Dryococelus australis TaxID=614101 RepID=A0ABQ9IFC9_9NEOP|nr:hypothetical protein PR048_000646 [Dryococelus australis]